MLRSRNTRESPFAPLDMLCALAGGCRWSRFPFIKNETRHASPALNGRSGNITSSYGEPAIAADFRRIFPSSSVLLNDTCISGFFEVVTVRIPGQSVHTQSTTWTNVCCVISSHLREGARRCRGDMGRPLSRQMTAVRIPRWSSKYRDSTNRGRNQPLPEHSATIPLK